MNNEVRERMSGKFFFEKIVLFSFILLFFLSCVPQSVLAGGLPTEKGSLGDTSWYVEEREGRIFYSTHGTFVWGHEFGFYKNPGDCKNDILWLTFSSMDERVKDFVGKEVVILLDIDGKIIEIGIDMLFAGTMGTTQVMYFTNWVVGPELLKVLMQGRHVEVKIVKPKELEVLLDIKFDEFSLEGFVASRQKATAMCNKLGDAEEKENIQLLLSSLFLGG